MKERPILFSAPLVRAILAGNKTQTRRVVKPQPSNDPSRRHPVTPYHNGEGGWNWVLAATGHGCGDPFPCPYGQPGDRLWVREAIRLVPDQPADDGIGPVLSTYVADGALTPADAWPWRRRYLPPMHCPRGLSRIDLEVTAVRVERLHAITEEGATAEGITDGGCLSCGEPEPCGCANARPDRVDAFARLWMQVYGQDAWLKNPWVWVIEFKRVVP